MYAKQQYKCQPAGVKKMNIEKNNKEALQQILDIKKDIMDEFQIISSRIEVAEHILKNEFGNQRSMNKADENLSITVRKMKDISVKILEAKIIMSAVK